MLKLGLTRNFLLRFVDLKFKLKCSTLFFQNSEFVFSIIPYSLQLFLSKTNPNKLFIKNTLLKADDEVLPLL